MEEQQKVQATQGLSNKQLIDLCEGHSELLSVQGNNRPVIIFNELIKRFKSILPDDQMEIRRFYSEKDIADLKKESYQDGYEDGHVNGSLFWND